MNAAAITVDFYSAIICLTFLLFLIVEKNEHNNSHTVFCTLLAVNICILVCDAITYLADGNQKAVYLLYVMYFIIFSLSYVLLLLYTCYIGTFVPKQGRGFVIVSRIIMVICVLSVIAVAVSMFNHMYFYIDDGGFYHRGQLFWFSQAYPVVVLITDLLLVLYNKNQIGSRNTMFLCSYSVFPIAALIVQMISVIFPLLYIATTLSLIIIFITVQQEQGRELHKKEKELSDATIAVMMTQVQPHFLYNALTSIAQLCEKDPSKAKSATIGFSNYLRGNLDSLNNPNPVSFESELYHTGNYLELEKIRFDDELDIEYNINVTDFYLPSLSLQPLVENAVKHGVGKKIGGGTVKISSFEDEYNYYITVEDNGVGFDMEKVNDDNRIHIGIENTKNRIGSQCGGDLKIESKVGIGTKATITIPRGDKI